MAQLPGIVVVLDKVQTNMVLFRVLGSLTAEMVVSMLKEQGVGCVPMGPDLIRMVTHLNVSSEDIAYTLSAAGDSEGETSGV
ncbi:MAG: hypothetical protein ACYC4H_00415 [Desulfocucumaceae bacterium]